MSGTRAISTTSRRELSSSFFLQGKAPNVIKTPLTETLACFLLGQAKDFSVPLYCKLLTKPPNLPPPEAQFVLLPTDDSISGTVGGPSVEPNLARKF